MESKYNMIFKLSPVLLVLGLVGVVFNWNPPHWNFWFTVSVVFTLGGLFGTALLMLEANDS